jgi:hypothetical protein
MGNYQKSVNYFLPTMKETILSHLSHYVVAETMIMADKIKNSFSDYLFPFVFFLVHCGQKLVKVCQILSSY